MGADGNPPLFRVHLPAMPFLRSLTIDDAVGAQLTQYESCDLNDALRRRMPRLEELNANLHAVRQAQAPQALASLSERGHEPHAE